MFYAQQTGVRYIALENGYKVWTRQVGSGAIKMLCLHGGPGVSSEYLESFEQHLVKENFEFYYYDQLGSGLSDKPEDRTLWQLSRFVDEVEAVRLSLGLQDFILFGQSWGGLLALEYALKYPGQLKGLIISNMTASVASYITNLNALRSQLPPEIQAKLSYYEAREQYADPEYNELMLQQLYSKHLCRVMPMPESLANTFANLNQTVYMTMQGPNEFVVTGNLKNWDRWADLPAIKIPTLLIVGRHDTMPVHDIEKMQRLMPNATLVICEQGSHCAMYDDPVCYFKALNDFVAKFT